MADIKDLSLYKQFGKSLREKEFLFDKDYLNLNHGSFGTYPLAIREVTRKYQDAAEARPDQFIRYDFPRLLDESRAALAKFLHCNTETITVVPNATTGVDTVLMNLAPTFGPNDRIVYFSHVYGACEKCVLWVAEQFPVKAVPINCTYPLSDDEIMSLFEDKIKEVEKAGHRVALALFDTLSSMPAMLLPYERLIKSCKAHGVYSLVDGAHGIGQLDLNLGELDPDFFVSNCHKWLLVPRGCAVMYTPLRNQGLIRTTLPTSHGFMPIATPDGRPVHNPLPASIKSPFLLNFQFVGTIDSSPYLCIPAAIEYREEILGGEERIRNYCRKLIVQAAEMTQKRLDTEIMSKSAEKTKADSLGCFMANVRLPLDPAELQRLCESRGQSFDPGMVRDWTMKRMLDAHGVFCAIFFYAGVWWYRLSAQVYLELADFEFGAEKILLVCKEVKEGAFLAS